MMYRNVLVGKSSDLHNALQLDQSKPENVKAVKKVFDDTTARYAALYSKEDREWFESTARRMAQITPGQMFEMYAR